MKYPVDITHLHKSILGMTGNRVVVKLLWSNPRKRKWLVAATMCNTLKYSTTLSSSLCRSGAAWRVNEECR